MEKERKIGIGLRRKKRNRKEKGKKEERMKRNGEMEVKMELKMDASEGRKKERNKSWLSVSLKATLTFNCVTSSLFSHRFTSRGSAVPAPAFLSLDITVSAEAAECARAMWT